MASSCTCTSARWHVELNRHIICKHTSYTSSAHACMHIRTHIIFLNNISKRTSVSRNNNIHTQHLHRRAHFSLFVRTECCGMLKPISRISITQSALHVCVFVWRTRCLDDVVVVPAPHTFACPNAFRTRMRARAYLVWPNVCALRAPHIICPKRVTLICKVEIYGMTDTLPDCVRGLNCARIATTQRVARARSRRPAFPD